MSQGPLCPNLSQKVKKEVSQMANCNLQMNFSYFNKMTGFTNIMTNVGNHKNSKFDLKRPKCL